MTYWPETVREAIEWVHEADLATMEAKRAHELAEAEALAAKKFPLTTGMSASVVRETAETRAKLDRLELEASMRHSWLTYVVARAGRREALGIWG